ncbi:hypothetical protein [Streptomonospora litoralis]|uniref:DUF1648 domain-containing protein n=1 Tax=Streptomonospora litoralis TaxID=2498135 RepID=A0A4P6Q7T7_9ACTN|nr:hypothetical protein [Streptomonospora litoralis]QBI55199.1 hypothetical protein EKD16_17155 [Streptomonospora litoralis]
MEERQRPESAEPVRAAPPWAGIAVAAVSMAAMAAADAALWDRIPEAVTTRESTVHRSAVRVPREVVAAAFPAALALVAALLAMSARVDAVLQRRLHTTPFAGAAPPPRTRTAGANTVLGLLGPFMALLHVGMLMHFAGYAVPVERGAAVAVGVLLVGVGVLVPRLGPPGEPVDPALKRLAAAWHRVQRPGGFATAALGAGTAAGALVLPPLAVALTAALLVAAVYGFMFALALRRLR